ncbi:MAG: thermonuclease family protein [Rhodobacteraceae bacterium]|nr:thermonuclease family protein [Paracoccaceae bacterium]
MAVCLAQGACAESPLVGPARVVDGDTLAMGAQKLRLYGIDAPEIHQTCRREGKAWPCGVFARDALAKLVALGRLSCAGQGHDRYGRVLVICQNGAGDIAEAMVRAGAATAYLRYSDRYAVPEDEARRAKRGIWAAIMLSPERYRHSSPKVAEAAAPGACTIKGNISAHGKIFHLPGQADYDRVTISPAKGERWFCSVAAAQAAGWRPALR